MGRERSRWTRCGCLARWMDGLAWHGIEGQAGRWRSEMDFFENCKEPRKDLQYAPALLAFQVPARRAEEKISNSLDLVQHGMKKASSSTAGEVTRLPLLFSTETGIVIDQRPSQPASRCSSSRSKRSFQPFIERGSTGLFKYEHFPLTCCFHSSRCYLEQCKRTWLR